MISRIVIKFYKMFSSLESLILMYRCNDEGTHVDEELYPALDETNPLLKNKKVSRVRFTCHI